MASMLSSTAVEMSVVCRCCLQEKSDLISIFKIVSETIPLNYAAVVKKCVGVKIIPGDGLPDQICSGCSEEAERSYKFKDMCISSDQQLRPSAEAEFVFNEVACQTDECHARVEKDGESLKGVDEQDTSKCAFQRSYEDLNISLSVEIKDVSVTGDQGIHKALENPSDLPLSEESILSVLDIEKNKVSDVLEGNELVSLSSPVSDGDFSNWLADNQEETKESTALAEQVNSMCEESKVSSNGNCFSGSSTFESKLPAEDASEDKPESDTTEIEKAGIDYILEGGLDENITDQTAKNNETGGGDEIGRCKSQLVSEVGEKIGSSVEGRVTVKSLEDLTYDVKSVPTTTVMSSSPNISAPKESELSGGVTDVELSLNNLLKGPGANGCRVVANSSSSSDSELLPPLRDRTLGQIITHSLDKCDRENLEESQLLNKHLGDSLNQGVEDGSHLENITVDQKNKAEDQLRVNSSEKHLGDSLDQDIEDDNHLENISDVNRKRPRGYDTKDSCDKDALEGSAGPLAKRTCTSEGSSEGSKELPSKEGDNEISSSEMTPSNVNPERERGNANVDETKESDEVNVSKKCTEAENELDAPENLSDEDLIGDDDSVSDSSGSEYLPVDSPEVSDDSARLLRPSTKPKTREKPRASKLGVQAFNIRECRVVLSDIARPGSSALTNSNSMSSHVSVSSLKSVENDEDNAKNSKEGVEKEAEEISDNTSSCTAWIKVEPEDMEELEEQTEEENALGAGEVDNGTLDHGMPSSSDINAEVAQGASAENQTILTKVVGGRRRFLCPFCAKAFHTRNQMILHRGVHTGDLPYPCEVCGKRFALRCRLLRHMSVHDASIVCEFCGMDFKTNILLGRHIKAKHTIPSYAYPQAPGIPAAPVSPVVKSPSKNTTSIPALPSKAVQRFPCRLCPRVFSSMNGLKGHKRAHNNHPLKTLPISEVSNPVEQKSDQNACKICGMSFPNLLYLKSHMVCHTIVRPNSGKVNSIEIPGTSNSAEESPRKGASSLKLQEENINVMEPTVLIHESPTAFGESPYQYNQPGLMMQNVCPVCSQIFTTQEKLLRHQVLANHNRNWNCEECPAMFSSAGQLQSHILSHHPAKSNFIKKEHKCNVCGKIFSKSSRLNQHMNYHLMASDPITCQMCGKYFASLEQLNIHKKTHESASLQGTGMNVSNDLCCSVCRRVFSKRSRLKRHMMLHESQSFPCSKCSKTFISEELLTEHQLHHTQSATQSPASQPSTVSQSPAESEESGGGSGIPCTACGRTFTNKARLKQHVVVHTKSGFVACQNCFKVFANGQMLEMHAMVCANTEDASDGSQSNVSNKSASLPHPSGFTSCTSCGKAFPSKELLTEHEKTCVGLTVVKKLDGTWKVLENAEDRTRVPSCSSNSSNSSSSGKSKQQNSNKEQVGEAKTYACKVCGKSFNNYHGLNSHMRFHQENSGVYKCELCGKLFPSRNKLSQHMSSHSAVYRCGICSQAFGFVEELKKHVSQCMAAQKGGSGTTSNYFHCSGCSEVFSLLEQLAGHIKCHADEFPHACSECYKVFAHPAQLSRHMTTHGIGETSKNTCKICHKTFSNRGSLDKHIVVHTGEKKFECPYCMQRFSQKSSLHRHKLTQHETKM